MERGRLTSVSVSVDMAVQIAAAEVHPPLAPPEPGLNRCGFVGTSDTEQLAVESRGLMEEQRGMTTKMWRNWAEVNRYLWR